MNEWLNLSEIKILLNALDIKEDVKTFYLRKKRNKKPIIDPTICAKKNHYELSEDSWIFDNDVSLLWAKGFLVRKSLLVYAVSCKGLIYLETMLNVRIKLKMEDVY